MPELSDLRGKTLNWLVSRSSPLLCAISWGSSPAGYLIQPVDDLSLQASLAGVHWTLRRSSWGIAVSFQNGPLIAEARYEVESLDALVDGLASYRFESRRTRRLPESRFPEGWTDDQDRQAILFSSYRNPYGRVESGEIVVSRTATIEHVPILVLLGIVRQARPTF